MPRDGIEHIAARAGGDIEDANWLAAAMKHLDGFVEQLLHVHLALPDAAPTGRVEVAAVNPSPEETEALRRVAIDVIKRLAGVEARLPTDSHAFAKPTHGIHRGPLNRKLPIF